MSDVTKMTIKVFSPLWEGFQSQTRRLPINRDRFLNDVIARETNRLAEAMESRKLSNDANRWISRQLKRLGTTTVNIGVEKKVANDLNDVIQRHNVVRDAFFNRLIMFLRSRDELLDAVDLPKRQDRRTLKEWADIDRPFSPLAALEDTFLDPLWYLHEAAKERHGMNLYRLDLRSSKLDGFSCWMEEKDVPSPNAREMQQKNSIELLASLDDFEAEAYPSIGTRLP